MKFLFLFWIVFSFGFVFIQGKGLKDENEVQKYGSTLLGLSNGLEEISRELRGLRAQLASLKKQGHVLYTMVKKDKQECKQQDKELSPEEGEGFLSYFGPL